MGFLAGLLGGGHTKTMPIAAAGLQLQSSTQGLPIPLVFGTNKVAPNLIWYGDFLAIAQASSAGSGGKGGVGGGGGGKGGGGSVQYTYQAAFQFGLCDGPILSVGNVYVNKQITSLSTLGYSLFLGDYAQSPWGYLTTNHPSQALNYHGLAHIDNPAYQMGNSPQIPNHNIEIGARYSASISGKVDADPSLVANFLLTDAKSGAGFPSAKLAALTTYQAYCIANGLWVSPVYTSQTPCSSMIKDLMIATNSAPVFSSGVLSVVPYGDQSITANGFTYTAPSTAQYDVGDDDFVFAPGNDPVMLNRSSNADAYNSIQLECLDRNNQYNPAVVGAKDQALIDAYGLRENTITTHYFADLNAGRLSAQLQLQREAVRNIYSFTLDHRYVLLDPMDLITLTCKREDGTLWLNKQFVRILTIDEDQDGNFAMTAEEYLSGSASAPAYTFQTGSGYTADYNGSPGNANTPVIFEPPVQIAQTGGLEVNIACSGGANWGGTDIWVSTDGNSYKIAGRVTGKARQGTLNGSLASGADPDITNTLHIDLSLSSGNLNSGTQADADANHTLCYVDGEYISYQTATLTSANHYDLTYLRRGQYGSPISAHSTAAQFARMDGGIFAYAFNKSQIGQTLYIKMLSFNVFGGGQQSLAGVSAYTHVLTGPPVPKQVQNFQAQQQGNVVAFNWTDLPYEGGLKGYDIAYGPIRSLWSSKLVLTQAHRGTEMTNASVPPGTWEFSIRAHDIADNLSAIESLVRLTITNINQVISQIVSERDWLGTLSGFYKHYTGVLTPLGTKTVDQYAAGEEFNQFVPDPVSSAYYIPQTIDTGYDSNTRVYSTIGTGLGYGQTGAPAVGMLIDTWLSAGSDLGVFINWIIGFLTFRYLRSKLSYTGITAGNVSYISDFTPTIDNPSNVENSVATIAAGGTTVTFPQQFHAAPYVYVTVIAGASLYGEATAITPTQCVINVFNNAGTSVGGTVNYSATGQ